MGVYQQPGVARAEVGVALTTECHAVMCSGGVDQAVMDLELKGLSAGASLNKLRADVELSAWVIGWGLFQWIVLSDRKSRTRWPTHKATHPSVKPQHYNVFRVKRTAWSARELATVVLPVYFWCPASNATKLEREDPRRP